MKFIPLAICATLLSGSAAADAADPLARFFEWWNITRASDVPFTGKGFAPFVTDDAVLQLDDKIVARGDRAWADYFQQARSRGSDVEIVLPFKQTFRTRDRVYTLHVVRARRPGAAATCVLTSGYATLRGGRISGMVLVRHALDAAAIRADTQCWQS